jgi:hypothetical protein
MGFKEVIKETIAKAITVGVTVTLADTSVMIAETITALAYGDPITITALEVKAVILVASYSVWTKVLVPFLKEKFLGNTKSGTYALSTKSAFELV